MKTAVGAGMYPIGAGLGFPFRTELLGAGREGCDKTTGRTAEYCVKQLSAVSFQI